MIKRARIEDAGVLADPAVQMWADHDPEDLEAEFREEVSYGFGIRGSRADHML